jgi:hypothetical protein
VLPFGKSDFPDYWRQGSSQHEEFTFPIGNRLPTPILRIMLTKGHLTMNWFGFDNTPRRVLNQEGIPLGVRIACLAAKLIGRK